ncbi:MAG: magnesium/cobalt transporter CorA [Desulfobacterales bacterium]|jgi:magnesium transporter
MQTSPTINNPIDRASRRAGQTRRTLTRFIKKPAHAPGTSPGTLVPAPEKKSAKSRMTLIAYDQERYLKKEIDIVEEALPLKDSPAVTWINIDGLHDIGLIESVGRQFGIHPLTQEDIVTIGQRPKAEEFDDYVYIVFKMLSYRDDLDQVKSEQISIVLGPNFLISFQETSGDVLAPVRERIEKGKGRIRKAGSDYLAYALIDAVVDHYFLVLESFGEKIEDLEAELLSDPTPKSLQHLYAMKRNVIFFRKQVWPIRELLNRLIKEETPLIDESVDVFLNDVYDHTIQVIDTIESFRDLMAGLLDIYLSTISNRMNEVMKMLTIMATIFIPLTFIAGIYGMNFEYMPELKWRWAYPALWGAFISIFLGMLAWFKHKKWL